MKKLLGIVVLGLTWCSAGYSLDRDTCADYSAKAKTDQGAKIMFSICLRENDTSFYNRSKKFKCAQKAAKANTNQGAKIKFSTCIRG